MAGNWDWNKRKAYSRREVESLRMLRDILNAPNAQAKRAVVAQYNPLHYIFGEVRGGLCDSSGRESVEVWDALRREQIRRRGF